ncbi:cysteine peptidase family C39 domain-containing protein [uncultured Methanobrevibacter sp.]|uniref:cysteine peptidase family C39 domain-containing protein n=1 Tax=uncultured Methanobrevibacter sp. TaxID=253161 RepID=UPI002638B4FC
MKNKKSILLMTCLLIFLLMNQVSAAENDTSNNIGDSNSSLSVEHNNLNDIIKSKLTEIGDKKQKEVNSSDLLEVDEEIEVIEDVKNTDGIVMAEDNSSCGQASLATALNRFDRNITLDEVSSLINGSENGTSMKSIVETARHYNLTAFGVELNTMDLKENFIVHLNLSEGGHWSLINNITDKYVFLADPIEGNINFTIAEFEKYFSGKAIIISRIDEESLRNQLTGQNIQIIENSDMDSIIGNGWERRIVGYKTVWKWGFIRKYGWKLQPVITAHGAQFSQWQYKKGYYYVWGKYKAKVPIYKYVYKNNDRLTSVSIKANIKKGKTISKAK